MLFDEILYNVFIAMSLFHTHYKPWGKSSLLHILVESYTLSDKTCSVLKAIHLICVQL